MKRFTETDKWRDPWFRSLKPPEKLVFLFVVENCNNAGFYEMDMEFMAILLGMKVEEVEGALKGLTRGIKGASGWVWVRRFLRHQKNEDLNPDNPAHKQIIGLVRDQVDRFGDCPEFGEFVAPLKGLLSPIGKGQVKDRGDSKGRFKKPSLEEAKVYGTQVSMAPEDVESWYDHFEANGWRVGGKALMVDWKAALRNGKRMAPALSHAKNGDPANSTRSIQTRL